MKILLIGAAGTIGQHLHTHFSTGHKVVTAGRKSGDYTVDIAQAETIDKLFQDTGPVDAVICAAGEAKWDDFDRLTEEDFYLGIKSKLMGQINLVRTGRKFLNSGGSITLTTGILAEDPVAGTTAAAMVNGAIHSFVKALALELQDGTRVNVVAPGLVEDAYLKYRDYFPGHTPVPMKKVALGYERSVLGRDHGKVIRVYN